MSCLSIIAILAAVRWYPVILVCIPLITGDVVLLSLFFFFFHRTQHLLHKGESGSLGPAVAAVWGRAHVIQAHGILGPGTV